MRAPIGDQGVNHVRISLSLGRPGDQDASVLFDIRLRGQSAGLLEARAEELGVPLSLTQARSASRGEAPHHELPGYVTSALQRVFPPGDEPLWLSLVQPCGFLPILPWERLLGSSLGCPIVRLPYSQVQPVTERTSIDMVVCFSLPYSGRLPHGAQAAVTQFAGLLPRQPPRPIRLHVSASDEVRPALPALEHLLAGSYSVNFLPLRPEALEPDAIASLEEQPPDLVCALFRETSEALAGTPIDALYLVSDAMLGRERGSLIVRETQGAAWAEPVTGEDAQAGPTGMLRFVGPPQVARFASRLGAWAVLIGSPPGGHSLAALRFLQHHLAPLTCGPLLLHELEPEHGNATLESAFQFLFDPSAQSFPRSPGLTLYCSPDWDREPASGEAAEARKLLDQFTLKGYLGEGLFDKAQPIVVTSIQRALERSAAGLNRKPGGPEREGAEQALRFTADLLAKHLSKFDGEVS